MHTTEYYNKTAASYDVVHGGDQNLEHVRALDLLVPRFFADSMSVLDVGCGTGRVLEWFRSSAPGMPGRTLTGIDPSEELLKIAAQKLPEAKFALGSGENLPFDNESFDLTVASAILHHVDNPKQVISEMFRVSRHGILISGHNNFAFRSDFFQRLRLALYACGLLDVFTFVKQGFKKQGYSEGDGWWYPYSLFEDFDVIARHSRDFFVTPTRRRNTQGLGNLMLSHSHIAVACLK